MKTRRHLCQSVSGALKNWGRREWANVARANNTTVEHVKGMFRIYEFEGKLVIPIGDNCPGFSYQTGCPGHAQEEESK